MRPLAVTLIGFYQALRAVLLLACAVGPLGILGLPGILLSPAVEGRAVAAALHSLDFWAGVVIFAAAVAMLAAGFGVLQMQNWGRMLTLVLSAGGLVLLLPAMTRKDASSLAFGLLDAACILYLAMPPVKRAFQAGGSALKMAA